MKSNKIKIYARLLFIASCCLLIIFSSGSTLKAQLQYRPVTSDTVTALFIGNSLTGFNQMYKTVENLGLAAGKNIFCDRKVVNGTSIVDIWNFPDTKEKILERNWSYVVMQGDIQSTAFPENHHEIMTWLEYQPMQPLLEEVKAFIQDNQPETQLVFFMPWAFEDGMTWIPGQTDTYYTMQELIYTNSINMANEVEIILAPVGWAWNRVFQDYDTQKLFLPDFVHPNDSGSYLTACVFYCTFFKERCDGNSHLGEMTEMDADFFQEVASSMVMNDLALWNLETTSSTENKDLLPTKFSLNQNYPNPFNPATKISFSLHVSGKVSLKIYNVLGNEIAELVNREVSSGFHEIEFDAASLPSGTYFYQLRHKDRIQTKKMIILK